MAWTLLACVAVILISCSGQRRSLVNTRNLCNRDPPDIESNRTPGDNGLRIQVLGHTERYTPGQVYTISINGTYPNQKLAGFMLVSVPLNAQDESTAMGTFQLIDSSRTRFATECPHIITHTDLQPKAGIEVLWTAPAPRVGCIEFRAAVIEHDDVWFKDDGALTRVFCEGTGRTENKKSPEMTPDCCACGSAKYQMTFHGKWSQQSHPKDYPTQRRLLHWSNIVGASHSKNFILWQYGDYASKGIKEVCEFGYPRTAEQEVLSHSREVRSIIKTSGIWWSEPHGINQKREARFSTDRRRHLVSMLTMIGPSPDWCVGISAVDLCLPNCTWMKELTFDLYPWDAGTDSGISFMSPNVKSDPQQKIHRITNTFPNNVASPFYGRDPVKPLAALKIEQIGGGGGGGGGGEGGESSCLNDDEDESEVDILGGTGDGLSDMDKQKLMMNQDGKCAISPWEDWSGCSVTCGVGQRSRKRTYVNAMVDENMCGLPVMESENCIGLENECETVDEDCAVTQWSNWSPCSVTCGKGTRERQRFHLAKDDMLRCNRTTQEVEMCVAKFSDCDSAKALRNFTAICSLPSVAGPCRGNFERWYFDVKMQKCLPFSFGGCRGNENQFETMDECTEACTPLRDGEQYTVEGQNSTPFSSITRAKCFLPSSQGPCRGNFERWYFDVNMQKCLPFEYGGCEGNENRFETMDECTRECSLVLDSGEGHLGPTTSADARGRCSLPSMHGPCRGNFRRWYFDVNMQKCLPFEYGGCEGNENRFETMDECTEACSLLRDDDERSNGGGGGAQRPAAGPTTALSVDRCALLPDHGPCKADLKKWFFDVDTGHCSQFRFGGCRGNENRFDSEEDCIKICLVGEDLENSDDAELERRRNLGTEACFLPRAPGPCNSNYRHWYYDTDILKCLPFTYGGCLGNQNRFPTADDCFRQCTAPLERPLPVNSPLILTLRPREESSPTNYPTTKSQVSRTQANRNHKDSHSAGHRIDCVVSAWVDWSSCSVSCGSGYRTRQRTVRRRAENGGKSCPRNLEQKKKCKTTSCRSTSPSVHDSSASSPCPLGPWGSWSSCSKTCGSDSIQQRERQKLNSSSSSSNCMIHMQRRICNQDPCPGDYDYDGPLLP